MFPSQYFYILFIIVFDSVIVHSHGTKEKTYIVTKKHISGVVPGNGSKLLLNAKREAQVFEDTDVQALYEYADNSDERSLDESQDISVKDEQNGTYDLKEFNSEGDEENGTYDLKEFRSEGDEENGTYNLKEFSSEGDERRAVEVGDVMTPPDMLPITSKLFEKGSGEGRGIVSSAKSPEDLADTLFAAFFITTQRIVHVTEADISGLDALSALALDGDEVVIRSPGNSLTEKPTETININGQYVELDPHPRRCHYKLIYKKVSPSDAVLRKGGKGGITPFNKISKLEKKMSPNRHLIINHKGRKTNKESNDFKTRVRAEANKEKMAKDREHKKYKLSKKGKKEVKKLKSKLKPNRSNLARNTKLNKQRKQRKITRNLNVPVTTTKRPVCKWRYICKIPGDLDSCRLHTSCVDDINNKPMLDKKYVDTRGLKNEEQEQLALHFRKMLGLTALDEQVEKILEEHVLLVKPQNMNPDSNVESLGEYFNNIIMAQNAETTPGVDSEESSEQTSRHPFNQVEEVTDTTPQDLIIARFRKNWSTRKNILDKMKSIPTSNLRDAVSVSTMITTPQYNKKHM